MFRPIESNRFVLRLSDFVSRFRFRTVCAGALIVLVLAICSVGVSIWRDRANAIDDGIRNARNIAVVLGGQIARSIQSIDIVIRQTQRRIEEFDFADPSGSTDLPRTRAFHLHMRQQLNSLPQAFHIVVSNAHGQVVASTAAWPTPSINIADRDHFAELAANDDGRLSISLPFENRINGEPTIVLARRINGPERRFLGIIFISVKKSYFEGIYNAVNALPHQTFLLLQRDGTVVIHHPHGQNNSGKKIAAAALPAFHKAAAGSGGSYRVVSAFDHIVRWVGVSPIAEYSLIVNSGIPEEVLLQDWRMRAIVTIALTLAFLGSALVLLSIMAFQYRDMHTSHIRFDAALNNMCEGLAMFDSDARLAVSNERYRQIHQLQPKRVRDGPRLDEILARSHVRCGFPADVDEYIERTKASVAARDVSPHEFTDANGRTYLVKNNHMPGGGWVSTFADVTDQRVGEEKIRRLAHRDLLTGAANRPRFLEKIEQARQRLRICSTPFNIIMLDLDRFKHVNDSLGHAAGDALLRETAQRLTRSMRAEDVLARLGGDEFAIIQMPSRTFASMNDSIPVMRECAIALSNRIIEVIGEAYDLDGQMAFVSGSIGIAMAPNDGEEPDELMKCADLALYATKSLGRNGYSFFDEELAMAATERQKLEADLRAGLSRNEFELYYQPEVDAKTEQPCCMEALVRWHHPDQGLLGPDRFIALSEDTGLIGLLGEWIVQAACAEAVNWPPTVKVAINVSAVQFRRGNLFDVIVCALVETGLPPERLEIEITERVLLENDTNSLSTLRQLKNLGVSIALDDFGTGYSSLSYIKMFPFDKIKIDRSFTSDLLERADCAAIVCAIVSLGRSLDIVTIAEGVETSAQFQALRAAGVTQAQGFLFGRPAPARDILFGVAGEKEPISLAG